MRNPIHSSNRPAGDAAAASGCPGNAGVLRLMLLALLMAVSACGADVGRDAAHRVNGSVHVEAGKSKDSAETVNGSIHIDANATVTQATTVNGSIHLGGHATADEVKSVNGGITLDDGARVSGAVTSVNGALTLKDGAEVGGALKNVSGDIELRSAHVAGGIHTVNGDISVLGASRVEGGIRVQKAGGLITITTGSPRIVIGPGATVQGDLRFEREVRLFVSDKATIGPVTGATAVAFTGDAPPG